MKNTLIRLSQIHQLAWKDGLKATPHYTINPTQLLYFSRDKNGQILHGDTRCLHLLKVPIQMTSRGKDIPPIDLSEGHQNFTSHSLDRSLSKIHDLMSAIQQLETQDELGKLREWAHFYTSRGALVDIAAMLGVKSSFKILISRVGDQIVMSTDNFRDQEITDPVHRKSMFSGIKFELVMKGGDPKDEVENASAFKTMVGTNLGPNNVVFSAEIDACLKPGVAELANYIELKNQLHYQNVNTYQIKLYKGILQCYISGTPLMLVGVRDSNFHLQELKKVHVVDYVRSKDLLGKRRDIAKSLQLLERVLTWIRAIVGDRAADRLYILQQDEKNWRLLNLEEISEPDKIAQIKQNTIGDEFTRFRNKSGV